MSSKGKVRYPLTLQYLPSLTSSIGDPLDVKCTPEHLYEISVLNFDWKVVGKRLLKPTYVNDIDLEEESEQRKRDRMVEKWSEIKGPEATYRAIITVFEKLSNRQAADAVRDLVMKGNPQCMLCVL